MRGRHDEDLFAGLWRNSEDPIARGCSLRDPNAIYKGFIDFVSGLILKYEGLDD